MSFTDFEKHIVKDLNRIHRKIQVFKSTSVNKQSNQYLADYYLNYLDGNLNAWYTKNFNDDWLKARPNTLSAFRELIETTFYANDKGDWYIPKGYTILPIGNIDEHGHWINPKTCPVTLSSLDSFIKIYILTVKKDLHK